MRVGTTNCRKFVVSFFFFFSSFVQRKEQNSAKKIPICLVDLTHTHTHIQIVYFYNFYHEAHWIWLIFNFLYVHVNVLLTVHVFVEHGKWHQKPKHNCFHVKRMHKISFVLSRMVQVEAIKKHWMTPKKCLCFDRKR